LQGGSANGADLRPAAVVQAVSGRLLDDLTGLWRTDDVFDPAFAPFNELGTSLLVMVTLDLGASCVVHEPSADEALSIARGELRPPSRPAACNKPPGKVLAEIRYGDGTHDRQMVNLSRFFPAFDGKVHVPILFYRRVCEPIELAVWTSAQKKPRVQRVEFRCAE